MHADVLTALEDFTVLPLLTGNQREHHGEIMREVAALAEAVRIEPRLDPNEYLLSEIGVAHEAVESGTAAGKVVISVS